MFAAHGDDKGLIVPPKLSRIQVVIVPIYKNENKDKVVQVRKRSRSKLGSLRCHVDEGTAIRLDGSSTTGS